jgi:hypothetical protein
MPLQTIWAQPPPTPGIGTGNFVEVNGVSAYQPPGTTVSFRPSGGGTRTVKKKVTLPAKKKMTYQEANIPEEKEPTIAMKQVFGSTVEQRRTYVRETQDYNKKIKEAKAEIDKYNQAVEEWNTKGRFQTVTQKVTEPRGYDITVAPSDRQLTKTRTTTITPLYNPEYRSPAQSEILKSFVTEPQMWGSTIEEAKQKEFIAGQKNRLSEFKTNLFAGFTVARTTLKEKGWKGLDALIQTEEKKLYKPQITSLYETVKEQPILGLPLKGIEAISYAGKQLVTKPRETSARAYIGSQNMIDYLKIGFTKAVTTPQRQLYTTEPIPGLENTGLKRIKPGVDLETQQQENLKQYNLQLENVASGFKIVTTTPPKQLYTLEPIPGLENTGLKRIKTYKSSLQTEYEQAQAFQFLTTPKTYYKGLAFAGETALLSGYPVKMYKDFTKYLRDVRIKEGAKYVAPEQLLSKQVFKDGKPTTSLVRTTSVKDAFGKLSKTKGVYPEYPEHYVLLTSEQSATPNQLRLLTQAEKKAIGLKTRFEDPSKWYSVKGEGNIWALRLSQDKYKYELSLLPQMPTSPAEPRFLETLVKRGTRYPKAVVLPKGFKTIEEYQNYLAVTKPSTSLFPKRSEASAIGYPKLRSMIKGIDPAIRGSSELQFVEGQNIILKPAKKLLKTPFGLKYGFEEYTIINGEVIPIGKGIVSGASIYTPGSRKALFQQFSKLKPMSIGQAGRTNFLTNVSKDIKLSTSISRDNYFDKLFRSSSGSAQQGVVKVVLPYYSIFKDGSSYTAPSYKPTYTPGYSTPSYPSKTITTTYKVPDPDRTYTPTTTTYRVTVPGYDYTTPPNTYTLTPPNYNIYPPTLTTTPATPPTTRKSKGKYKQYGRPEDRPYDTYVLDKDKWIKANKGNEKSNYYGALKLGADVTDNSSSRSFKIKPTTGKITNYYPYQPQLIKFYQPSKTGKPKLTTAFIEKTKYLIDTAGERQQITAKGIIANRRKTFRGF